MFFTEYNSNLSHTDWTSSAYLQATYKLQVGHTDTLFVRAGWQIWQQNSWPPRWLTIQTNTQFFVFFPEKKKKKKKTTYFDLCECVQNLTTTYVK